MSEVETYFASAERKGKEDLMDSVKELSDLPCLSLVLDSLPYISFILNNDRQLLIANRAFRDKLEVDADEKLVGKRPGELVNCIHSRKMPGGCGAAWDCQFCGAIATVLESRDKNEFVSREARLITDVNGTDHHMDLVVTSSPITIGNNTHFLVTMVDNTSEKRRRTMERVFFHDVMNTTHGLNGAIQLMQDLDSPDQLKSMLKTSQKMVDDLAEEISFQKELTSAEAGELKITETLILSTDLLEEVMRSMLSTYPARGKTIVISKSAEKFTFESDEHLVRRILVNMTKNALEASEKGDQVKLDCRIDGDVFEFSVWNRSVMPAEVKSQLWQRSFSTKGSNRGIGTYSMKLFAEQYLGGEIDFTSAEGKGTRFFLRL